MIKCFLFFFVDKGFVDKGSKNPEGMLQLYNTYSRVIKFTELPDPSETWQLGELIGEGTYGDVYTAKHKVTGKLLYAYCITNVFKS